MWPHLEGKESQKQSLISIFPQLTIGLQCDRLQTQETKYSQCNAGHIRPDTAKCQNGSRFRMENFKTTCVKQY